MWTIVCMTMLGVYYMADVRVYCIMYHRWRRTPLRITSIYPPQDRLAPLVADTLEVVDSLCRKQ